MSEFGKHSDSTGGKPVVPEDLTASFYETSERIRKALKQDLAECHLSREEVAIRLTVRMGRVSLAMLDAYVAETKANKFPAELIPAWIEVTGSRRILELLCSEVKLSIATEEDRDFAALARAEMLAERLKAKLRAKK